jgi:hypothetical protein
MSTETFTTRLGLLTMAVAGVTFLAACIFVALPVAFGEESAPEQNLTEQLSADTAAGVLSRDEAAIYAFLRCSHPTNCRRATRVCLSTRLTVQTAWCVRRKTRPRA